MSKIGVVMVHGMGEQKPGYSDPWKEGIHRYMPDAAFSSIAFGEVYYQDLLEGNQAAFWDQLNFPVLGKNTVRNGVVLLVALLVGPLIVAVALGFVLAPLATLLMSVGAFVLLAGLLVLFWRGAMPALWGTVRKFFLSAFSDPASYGFRSSLPGSTYERVHTKFGLIFEAVEAQLDDSDAPIVIVAHSLGAHIMSNFLWDTVAAGGSSPPWLGRISHMYTAGCNIPLFVAGQPEIKPVVLPNPSFDWHNYYDQDDILGWPLQQLQAPVAPPSYNDVVMDHPINVVGFLLNRTPLAHTLYFDSASFLKPLADTLTELADGLP